MSKLLGEIPDTAVLLDLPAKPATATNLFSSIEGLRNHLDNNHIVVMAEIESMQVKLRKLLSEVVPAYTLKDATANESPTR